MTKFLKTSVLSVGLLFAVQGAEAACPSNGTVSVPFPTGTADVVVYSSPACVALVGTDLKVQAVNASGVVLGPSSVPSVTADATGLHLTANGGAFGAAYVLYITHLPSGKATSIVANMGQATVAITTSTTTP